jgi:hypothetical protein
VRRLLGLALLAVLIGSVGVGAAALVLRPAAETPQAAAAPPSPLQTHWTYDTEQQWIVAEVSRALVNMGHYARTGGAADDARPVPVATETDAQGRPTFVVGVPGLDHPVRLVVAEHILSPGMYAPLAREIVQSAAAPAATDTAEPAAIATLVQPLTPVLVAESGRVSSRLAAHMTDAAAHEDAALLLSALALRECAGEFHDTRRISFRLASHLAMATALRNGGPPGPSGQLAEIALESLAFRASDALVRLQAWDAWPNPSAAARAWGRALRMHNTEDWRLLPDPPAATLLERLEWMHWASIKIDLAYALDAFDRGQMEEIPDWSNQVMFGRHSVAMGNRFSGSGLALVFQDARAMPLGLNDTDDPAAWVRALNLEPSAGPVRQDGGRVVVEVLDRGTWAAYAQRELLHQVHTGMVFQDTMLGLPDQARASLLGFEKTFGGLRLFPFVSLLRAKDRGRHAAAMHQGLEILARRPELVGAKLWEALAEPPFFEADTFDVPPLERWCNPIFPAGTYIEWPKRLWRRGVDPRRGGEVRLGAADLKRMRAALPFDSHIARAEIQSRLGMEAPGAVLQREYGSLLDYDMGLVAVVAERSEDDPQEYAKLYRRLGALNPDKLPTLARYQADRGDKEGARATYEDYFARARDGVGMCNEAGWLVDHYREQGDPKRALKLAEQAAQAYCAQGLLTLGRLYERLGRWTEAEAQFRQEAERYDDEPRLLAFYLRHERATKDDRYAAERKRLLAQDFPQGIEAVAQDVGPPTDGLVVIKGSSKNAEQAGLRVGDVVVGIDGHRVRTHRQYRVLHELSDAPEVTLRVWRGGYLDLRPARRDRRFGVRVRAQGGPADGEARFL